MNYARASDSSYMVRLDPGDDIHASLVDLCATEGIKNAAVSGIGSVVGAKLAHYRKDTKAYSEKQVEGILEIAALTGNIALFEDQPLPHLHAVVSDPSMQAFAGHLVQATCSATVELIVTKFDSSFSKAMNDQIGLKLWELD